MHATGRQQAGEFVTSCFEYSVTQDTAAAAAEAVSLPRQCWSHEGGFNRPIGFRLEINSSTARGSHHGLIDAKTVHPCFVSRILVHTHAK